MSPRNNRVAIGIGIFKKWSQINSCALQEHLNLSSNSNSNTTCFVCRSQERDTLKEWSSVKATQHQPVGILFCFALVFNSRWNIVWWSALLYLILGNGLPHYSTLPNIIQNNRNEGLISHRTYGTVFNIYIILILGYSNTEWNHIYLYNSDYISQKKQYINKRKKKIKWI